MLIAVAGFSVGTDPAGGPGTESWERAKQSFDRGQYAEVVPELEHAALPGSPFQEAATVWRLVLLGGLARGYLTLAGSHAERE